GPSQGQTRAKAVGRYSGATFLAVLVVVLLATAAPRRGGGSLLAPLLGGVAFLGAVLVPWFHLHISAGGYLLIGVPLFVVWLVVLLFIDRQTYLVATPGQVRVKTEIGGGELAYNATGMTFQK